MKEIITNGNFEGIPCAITIQKKEDKKWFNVRKDFDFGECTAAEA